VNFTPFTLLAKAPSFLIRHHVGKLHVSVRPSILAEVAMNRILLDHRTFISTKRETCDLRRGTRNKAIQQMLFRFVKVAELKTIPEHIRSSIQLVTMVKPSGFNSR